MSDLRNDVIHWAKKFIKMPEVGRKEMKRGKTKCLIKEGGMHVFHQAPKGNWSYARLAI